MWLSTSTISHLGPACCYVNVLHWSLLGCYNYVDCSLLQVGRDKARTALSLVGYDDELRPAMEYVFGSTLVCDTLENAKKVAT